MILATELIQKPQANSEPSTGRVLREICDGLGITELEDLSFET